MSSAEGTPVNVGGGNPSSKGKEIEDSSSNTSNLNVDELNSNMETVALDTDKEGEWQVITKKSKNRNGAGSSKSSSTSNTAPKVWGKNGATNFVPQKSQENTRNRAPDPRKQGGRTNLKSHLSDWNWESTYIAPAAPLPDVPAPLLHGWQWAVKGSSSYKQNPHGSGNNNHISLEEPLEGYDSDYERYHQQPNNCDYEDVDEDDDDGDLVEDSDNDLSDSYDSDVSLKSHETRKKNNWFKTFYEELDKLTVEQINEPTRQWHCPACKDGPGAIDWYRGLLPLITHAKTKRAKRVKLHRELAEVLEEELHIRGTSAIPTGEAFGQWKGLKETIADYEIVWPPMVFVMNTMLDKDENDKWIGMGNQELVDYFRDYSVQRARHSYGPQGHRGMSILIFEPSAVGYLEAERLHKHFVDQRTDRDAWNRPGKRLFCPGGKRQLYGFLACKEDMDIFNKHCQGKTKVKFEMKSYHEKVVSHMRQMSEDNQQLVYYKNQVARQELHKKTLQESFGVVSQKLRETMEENRIVRERTTEQYKENKLEMDYQEKFFKEQMAKVHKATAQKEKEFERLLQEERAKARKADLSFGTKEDCRLRKKEITKFIDSQVKGVKEFEAAREELIGMFEEKRVAMMCRHLADYVELEKEFDTELTKLMEKFAPQTFDTSTSYS